MTIKTVELTADLLNNHLAFLASHRGTVTRELGAVSVTSDQTEFTFTLLQQPTLSDLDILATRWRRIHLLPESEMLAPELEKRGFRAAGGLVYMTFAGDPAMWRQDNIEFEVRAAHHPQAIDQFSGVQTAGFLGKSHGPEYEHWRAWLGTANLRCLVDPRQSFYVGSVGGQPLGVTLVVRTNEIAGIYAVATLLEARCRGVSTSVLRHAVEHW